MTEPREKKFLFEWRRTCSDEKPFDYSAKDGNVGIGRIYKVNGGPEHDRWHWAIHAFLPLPAEGPKKGAIREAKMGLPTPATRPAGRSKRATSGCATELPRFS